MTARRVLATTTLLLFAIPLFATTTASLPNADRALPRVRTKKDERKIEAPAATVLCYHIVEAPLDPRMEISRDTFHQQMRYLEMTGYNVVPLRHVYEYMMGKRASLPKNAIVITIDDGWRSAYTEVFPEMQRRKWPFTVFLYPWIIGNTTNALTWKQVREMADAGVDVQSHSYSHPYLTKRRHTSMNDEQYAAWLERELAESKRQLEKKTGRTVEFLAYPYGDYDTRLTAAVAKAGYSAALTCDFGHIRRGADPLRMKRVVIDKRMDFATLRKYLGAERMQLAEMTPTPGKPVDPGLTTISAKIPNHQNLDPKSVGMALLSLTDTIPYTYDAQSGAVTLMMRDALSSLKARYHRAIVWANDAKTGRRVEASWVFRLPDPNAPPPPPPVAPAPPAVVDNVPPVTPAGSH